MSSYGQHSSTLFLHVQSAQNLATQANAAFCTTFVWSNSSPDGPAQSRSKPKYTSFTRVRENKPVAWNEDVEFDVTNPKSDVLTVRVNDSSDALVGSCNIYLAHLRPWETLDQWFQLHPAGNIHLKLTLKPNQWSAPTHVHASPYSSDLHGIEMMKHAMDVRCMLNQYLMYHQQATRNFLQYPTGYLRYQASGANFHDMMGAAADISTIAANMQELSGDNGLGSIASIGLGALGLDSFGAFFGS